MRTALERNQMFEPQVALYSLYLHMCAYVVYMFSISWNRCGAVVLAPALRPGLQPPAGALPAGSSLLTALPQNSKDTHALPGSCMGFSGYKHSPHIPRMRPERCCKNVISLCSLIWRGTRCSSRRLTAPAPFDIFLQRRPMLE